MVCSYDRLAKVPKRSFFLLGMHGAGKSTWVRTALPDAVYFDLLDEQIYQQHLTFPGLFAQSIDHLSAGDWVVVDEIQRLPWMLNEVHRHIESHRLRFAILISSFRELRAPDTNLLGGRAILENMFPLTAAELGADFDLDRVLRYGSLPAVWSSEEPREVLEAYARHIKEEICGEAPADDCPGFTRFLPQAALFNSQTINLTVLARQACVNRATLRQYLDTLEDTQITYCLHPFADTIRTLVRGIPKLYWVDPGIARAMQQELGPVTDAERDPLLKSWALTTLRAHNATTSDGQGNFHQTFDEIMYWSPPRSHAEVDFLLRNDRDYLAINVRATNQCQPASLKGLRAIISLPRVTRRLLVYTGEESHQSPDGIDVWPVERFADAVAKGELWG